MTQIAGFCVPAENADAVTLLLGIDPETGDELPVSHSIEHLGPFIRWCSEDKWTEILGISRWLDEFPRLGEKSFNEDMKFYQYIWSRALTDVEMFGLGYSFRHLTDIQSAENLASCRNNLQTQFDKRATSYNSQNFSHPVNFTFPFPGNGPPARVLEDHADLDQQMRSLLGLGQVEPGLLLNYADARTHRIDDLLDPRHFEDFVATIFREQGWNVHLTPQTRDGGKDILATRDGPNSPETTYIEAKCYSDQHPVSIGAVKEFTATVAGDDLDRGHLVTTSHVSDPAQKWAQNKGAKLAEIDFMDGTKLARTLSALTHKTPGVYQIRS